MQTDSTHMVARPVEENRLRQRRRTSASTGRVLLRVFRGLGKYTVLLFFGALSILPFIWIVGIALKTKNEFYSAPFALPAAPQWGNLADAWTVGHFGEFFMNSIIITLPTVAGVLLCCSLGSYALAKIEFVGRNVVFYLFLAGIIIPFQAIMVPLYYELRDLRLLTTYWAGILPMIALGIPFGMFLLRAFFLSLPGELIDAAKIDGCDDLPRLLVRHAPLGQAGSLHARHCPVHRLLERLPAAAAVPAEAEPAPPHSGLALLPDALRIRLHADLGTALPSLSSR